MKKINAVVAAAICLASVSVVAITGCDAPKKETEKKSEAPVSVPSSNTPPPSSNTPPTAPEAPKN